jgi:chromatin segregation and condensation protein Rec8/ScpA/Scc1 (kleisin family)
MIKSAAIVKTKSLAPWREMRLQKRKLKKAQALERKQNKRVTPTPIGLSLAASEPVESIEDDLPSREEMLQQAEAIGLKVDKRWSDATMLDKINNAMETA